MSKPLNQLVVEAFTKLRGWISGHPLFLPIIEEGLKEYNPILRGAIEENLRHMLEDDISCTEVLLNLKKSIDNGYLVIMNSTNGSETLVLKQGIRRRLEEKGFSREEMTRLHGFIQYFYKLCLISDSLSQT